MSTPVVIDKNTYKIMKYVYRHHEVSLLKIKNKFGDDGISSICYLCSNEYGAYRKPDNILTYNTYELSSDGWFGLTPTGNAFVENQLNSFIRWIIPVIVSYSALIVSIIALLLG